MKKVLKDTKLLLFENMLKINSDFKLNENDNKWIQKAVNPEHIGYCTPMTKSTCTPERKALAQRFKKGISEINSLDNTTNFEPNNPEYKLKIDKIKAVIDDLFNNQDYDIIDTMYRLFVDRNKPKVISNTVTQGINENIFPEYQKRVQLLKGKIDFLAQNNHLDIIDKIDALMYKLFPSGDESEMN